MKIVQYKCVICGKITNGRRTGKHADDSERYPRRHKADGLPCPGNYEFAEWVEVEGSMNVITGKIRKGLTFRT